MNSALPNSPKPRKPQIDLTVTERIALSPSMVRVVARIAEPQLFQDIVPPEKYVKLVFFDPALGLVPHPDYWHLRDTLPPQQQPVTRHMTLRRVDLERAEVWIDVALHGDTGYAGPWAARATPGDTIVAVGPGGKWIPDDDAAWNLFVGDDAAIPAVAANLEALPRDARGEVILEVEDAEHEQEIAVPSGMTVHWCHRSGHGTGASGKPGTRPLVEAVKAAAWPESPEGVQVFAHGEREAMKLLRPVFFDHHGLSRDQVSLSGYWAQGRTEEVFQAEKRTPIGEI